MSAATPTAPDQEVDRYVAVRQYSMGGILAVWAAAAVPMGLLAWVVAPWLADQLVGDEPLTEALLIVLTVGLIWQFVLVLILLRRELGSVGWSRVRDALWLQSPRDPRTGRVGGRVGGGCCSSSPLLRCGRWCPRSQVPRPEISAISSAPTVARPSSATRGAGSRSSSCSSSSTPCLARSCSSGGCCCRACEPSSAGGTGVANGVLFTLYHLHVPWVMPTTLVEGIYLEAYPARRFQSAWMGIIVHSVQSVFVIAVVLALVLK